MITLIAALALQSADVVAEVDPIGDLIAARDDAVGSSAAAASSPTTGCFGDRIEGGLLICRYAPGARVTLGETTAIANDAGLAVLGIPRRAEDELTFTVAGAPVAVSETWSITSREYNLQHVQGVPQRTVTPDESTLPRRQREYAQKQAAFNSSWDGQGFLDGFIPPSEGITTGVYGSARVYNGTEGSPHWGLDWANEVGTPVVAPASGLVTLAEPDMFYEGGLIFIDHGQGLVSAFLHMSAVHVSEGDVVEQGQLIGDIGAGGRATGPHLDWRVKLRNQFYVDPAILLDMDMSALQAD